MSQRSTRERKNEKEEKQMTKMPKLKNRQKISKKKILFCFVGPSGAPVPEFYTDYLRLFIRIIFRQQIQKQFLVGKASIFFQKSPHPQADRERDSFIFLKNKK